ncbi:hypothetical protein FOMG_03673 [Fusarium oxysporum f. sp. melonis 26406]|uniref:Uncharacterized protein n=1 Tax=Fusarium oxysporum f. sp. melonis 26406 TaxID=1089452 RepID=X0ALS5_FUSOX|nr:hypothetical protein FOMG_03673 [Fusarium oxysporum f. sp. melonis 26406]
MASSQEVTVTDGCSDFHLMLWALQDFILCSS